MIPNIPEGHLEIDLHIKHHFGGGVYAKEMTLEKKGNIVVQHKHKFDHLSILAKGSAKVIVEGEEKVYHSPSAVLIKAHEHHSVEALEDNTVWYCIHSIGDIDNEDEADVYIIER